MSTTRLTAEQAGRAISDASLRDLDATWARARIGNELRFLSRGEITRGTRYLRRKRARMAERIRHTSNVRAMHKVAAASGLPA